MKNMKARKGNRIITITEAEKDFYLAQGYDIVEFNDTTKEYDVVVEAKAGKTYSISEYNALKTELETVKKSKTAKGVKDLQEKLDAANELIVEKDNLIAELQARIVLTPETPEAPAE